MSIHSGRDKTLLFFLHGENLSHGALRIFVLNFFKLYI